jgi:hypothetical protein
MQKIICLAAEEFLPRITQIVTDYVVVIAKHNGLLADNV